MVSVSRKGEAERGRERPEKEGRGEKKEEGEGLGLCGGGGRRVMLGQWWGCSGEAEKREARGREGEERE